jgi:hypothetical protein
MISLTAMTNQLTRAQMFGLGFDQLDSAEYN